MAAATSISIFLVDGHPDSVRLVTKSNWTGAAIICSRAQFPSVKKRAEFNRTGVYLLLGFDESEQLPKIYVGEGDPVLNRIEAHEKSKEFWESVIVFSKTDSSLNKAHIQYLESRLVELAREAKRCKVENGNSPTLPAISEMDVSDMDSFLSDMKVVYSVLGVKVFDVPKIDTADRDDAVLLRLKSGSEIIAYGADRAEGFVVTKGSKCLKKEVPSFPARAKAFRDSLIALGVLASLDSKFYSFSQDYVFNSPSAASDTILGRSANGRIEWKDDKGKTLKDIQES
jgi:hypothetical protein